MNRKNIHVFTGIDTDTSPMAVDGSKANTIHNLRINANEAYTDNSSIKITSDPSHPLNLSVSPELGQHRIDTFIFGKYLGHCVCNESVVIFSIYTPATDPNYDFAEHNNTPYPQVYYNQLDAGYSYDMIVKYNIKNVVGDEISFEKPIILLATKREKEEEMFNIKHPIESLSLYENEKIQRVYFVDGIHQPRVINVSDYMFTKRRKSVNPNPAYPSNTVWNTYYTSYDEINFSPSFLNNPAFNCDITIRNEQGNGQFKPGTIQYLFTLVSNNDVETPIYHISPMYYLTEKNRGRTTETMVNNVFTINIDNIVNYDNFYKINVYAISRTSLGSNVARKLDSVNISNSIELVDDGARGETVDYQSLLFLGTEKITAYTLAQKDNTLFLGNLTYIHKELPDINAEEYKTDLVGIDYFGNAVYDYYSGEHPLFDEPQLFFNKDHNNYSIIRPNITYIPYSPDDNMQYDKYEYDDFRSARAVKRFKSGEFYRLGIIGQFDNGKMSEVLPLDIVYNPYKPILRQSSIGVDDNNNPTYNQLVSELGTSFDNFQSIDIDDEEWSKVVDYDNQIGCYLTTGFRVLFENTGFIEKCRNIGICKLYPVVLYPNSQYRAVLTQGLLSPTTFNALKVDNSVISVDSSWLYRPYGKGIFNDNNIVRVEGKSHKMTYVKGEDQDDGVSGSFEYKPVTAYNFACITTGSHYRALYPNTMPNGEISTNMIGCPVDYRHYRCTSAGNHTFARYDSTTLYYGNKKQLRLNSPYLYKGSELLSKSEFEEYTHTQFFMNGHILTLNSPETELGMLDNVSSSTTSKYKLRVVGYSDYCTSHATNNIGTDIDVIKDTFKISKYTHNALGPTSTRSYLTNPAITNSVDNMYKWYLGNQYNGDTFLAIGETIKDNSYVHMTPVYPGDCLWSNHSTILDTHITNTNRNVRVYNAYGYTNYFTVQTNNIPLYDFALTSNNMVGRLKYKDVYGESSIITNVDTQYTLSEFFVAKTFTTNHDDTLNEEVTKIYGPREFYFSPESNANRFRSSYCASVYNQFNIRSDNHNNLEGVVGDLDTVVKLTYNGHDVDAVTSREMWTKTPVISWWGTEDDGNPYINAYNRNDQNICCVLDNLPYCMGATEQEDGMPDNIVFPENCVTDNTSVTIQYHSSPYIALCLNTVTLEDGTVCDAVLGNDPYGQYDTEEHTRPYWSDDNNGYYSYNIIDKVYGYPDSIGQFIGELYREPEEIKIVFNIEDVNGQTIKTSINKEASNWMGGESSLIDKDWVICGDAININENPQTTQTFNSTTNSWVNQNDKYELVYTEGDCYLGRYDSLKTYPFNNTEDRGVVEIYSTVLESRVNLDERVDFKASDRSGDLGDVSITYSNFNLFNQQAYEQTSGLTPYHTLDKDRILATEFPNMVTWSMSKTLGEEIDTWSHITMMNTLDLDGVFGPIESLQYMSDAVFAFQNKAISLINFNTRVQIPTSDNNPIEITNGYKVDGKKVVSDKFGCSNKWSIVIGSNGAYFIDDINNKACLFNGQNVTPISTQMSVQRLFDSLHQNLHDYYTYNLWNPEDFNYCVCYYDNRRKDVYYIFKDTVVVFNEFLNTFVGTFDYQKTKAMFNIEDKFLSIYYSNTNNRDYMWQMFCSSDYGYFYGEYVQDSVTNTEVFIPNYKSYTLSYVENGSAVEDKVFNTIEWFSSEDDFFDTLAVKTIDSDTTQALKLGYRGNIKQRYNYYRCSIDTFSNSTPLRRLPRHRYPYSQITLTKNNINNFKKIGVLYNVATTYTI